MWSVTNLKMLMILLISSFCFCNNGSVAITPNDGLVVHSGFSPSMPITQCSPTCGKGFQVVARAFTKPSPKYGGGDCEGSNEKQRSCMMDCEVNDWIKNMEQQHVSPENMSREVDKLEDIVKEVNKPEDITSGEGFQIFTRNCTSPASKQGGREFYCPRKETRFVKSDADSEVKKHTTEDQRKGDVAKDTVQPFKKNLGIHHQWSEWTSWSACPDGRSRSIRTRSSTKGYDKETRDCSLLHKAEPKPLRPRDHVRDEDRTQAKSKTRPPRVNFEDVPKPAKTLRTYPLLKAVRDSRSPIKATPKSSNDEAITGALVVGVVFLGAIISIYFKECKKLISHKTGKEKRQEMRKKTSVECSDNIVKRFVKGLKEYSKLTQSDPNADRTACSRHEKNDNNAIRKSKKSKVPKSKS